MISYHEHTLLYMLFLFVNITWVLSEQQDDTRRVLCESLIMQQRGWLITEPNMNIHGCAVNVDIEHWHWTQWIRQIVMSYVVDMLSGLQVTRTQMIDEDT